MVSVVADDVPKVSVEYINKSTSAYTNAINKIGRIVFKNGNAAIIYEDKSVEDLGEIDAINQISFSMENSTEIVNVGESPDIINEQEISVSVYPNPVSDILNIEGKREGQIVRLFDQEGRLVYSDKKNTINLKDMTQGIYLLKVGNDVFKIIKK